MPCFGFCCIKQRCNSWYKEKLLLLLELSKKSKERCLRTWRMETKTAVTLVHLVQRSYNALWHRNKALGRSCHNALGTRRWACPDRSSGFPLAPCLTTRPPEQRSCSASAICPASDKTVTFLQQQQSCKGNFKPKIHQINIQPPFFYLFKSVQINTVTVLNTY